MILSALQMIPQSADGKNELPTHFAFTYQLCLSMLYLNEFVSFVVDGGDI